MKNVTRGGGGVKKVSRIIWMTPYKRLRISTSLLGLSLIKLSCASPPSIDLSAHQIMFVNNLYV
jgi:hypothetical protein